VLQLGTEVTSARHRSGGGWTLTLGDGRREDFDALLVASGHHWDPRMPSYPGTFSGTLLHSHAYKRAEPFAGQRVLVIGGGNSACDIPV
jgi:cation diffusion facilitator CzcD-associated flavoprotein CzcO